MCFLRFGLVGLGWSRMGIEEHVVLFSFLFFLFLVVFIIVLIVKNIKVTILPFYTLLKLWSTSIFLVKYWTRGWKSSFSHMRMKDLRTWELQMKGKSKSCKNLKKFETVTAIILTINHIHVNNTKICRND